MQIYNVCLLAYLLSRTCNYSRSFFSGFAKDLCFEKHISWHRDCVFSNAFRIQQKENLSLRQGVEPRPRTSERSSEPLRKKSFKAEIDLGQLKQPAWETVFLALAKQPGVTMFLGASDTGKTTCLRAAASHLAQQGLLPLAIVDADIGQSTVGPPTAVGLTLVTKHNLPGLLTDRLPCHAMSFVGALSPVGHLLQIIVATKRLVDKALRRDARTVLVDTTGLIGQSVGFQLKLYKIALLEPRYIVALQREGELEGLLSVLVDRPGLTVHRLPVSYQVRTRSPAERYRYRTSRFAAYFRGATKVPLETSKVSVLSPPTGLSKVTGESLSSVISLDSFPSQNLAGCLVGLNNASNETLALGLLERVTRHGQKSVVLTPLRNFTRVRIVQMANIRLAKTGEELGRPTGSRSIQIRRVEGA